MKLESFSNLRMNFPISFLSISFRTFQLKRSQLLVFCNCPFQLHLSPFWTIQFYGSIFAMVQLIRRVLKSFLNFFLEKISVSGPLKGWTVKPPVRTTLIFSLKPKFRINKHDLVGIIQNCENEKTNFRLEIFESKSFLFFSTKKR